MERFRIFRVYSDRRRRKTIKIVYSEATAKLHCSSPLTKGELRNGVKWADHYERIGDKTNG